jgi:glutamate-ammonia-ligase adenylyltransferase
MTRLADRLSPCGPILDAKAAERIRELLADRIGGEAFEAAWPSLAPVFAASPYLAGLARRRPAALRETLESDPEDRLGDILQRAHDQAGELDDDVGRRVLRELKGDLHLLTAIADLGGVWDLDAVTGALARFADAALHAAVALVARAEIERGRLVEVPPSAAGPIPGMMIIAMGKHGAFELNYSSDIDIWTTHDSSLRVHATVPLVASSQNYGKYETERSGLDITS